MILSPSAMPSYDALDGMKRQNPHPQRWMGPTLYVPAAHPSVETILHGQFKVPLDSAVICFEDSLSENDIPVSLTRFSALLADDHPSCQTSSKTRLFVRPRSPEMLKELAQWPGAQRLTGVVLPKWGLRSMRAWEQAVERQPHWWLMPTLENTQVFHPDTMRRLCDDLYHSHLADRVIALRIGGNDLLARLGLRRERGISLYEGPLAPVLFELLRIFVPAGFSLTAPVYDFIDDPETLKKETQRDVHYGFCGKTAIHPAQLPTIRKAFQPTETDVILANKIANPVAPAVFLSDGRMVEVMVHRPWARHILERATRFGIRSPSKQATDGSAPKHPRQATISKENPVMTGSSKGVPLSG